MLLRSLSIHVPLTVVTVCTTGSGSLFIGGRPVAVSAFSPMTPAPLAVGLVGTVVADGLPADTTELKLLLLDAPTVFLIRIESRLDITS
jgi:hypothetical protein